MPDPTKAAEEPKLPPAANTEENPAPAAKPRTRLIRVRLSQLLLKFEDYSHRDKGAFDLAALQPLLDSISGMEVEVVELLDTTDLDRLAWSLADNEVRLNLTASERFGVVKKFAKAGMPDERGVSALGLSVKQYRRDLGLVRNAWMLALVTKDTIPATTAVDLVEAADKKTKARNSSGAPQKLYRERTDAPRRPSLAGVIPERPDGRSLRHRPLCALLPTATERNGVMAVPSPEMWNALVDFVCNELRSLPEAEVKRLLKGIWAIVSDEQYWQAERCAEGPTLDTLVSDQPEQWHASLRRQAACSN